LKNMDDPLKSVVPGQPMSEEQRKAMAKANEESSAEAQRMAAEHIAREGHEAPVASVVAGSVLEKLKNLPPEKKAE